MIGKKAWLSLFTVILTLPLFGQSSPTSFNALTSEVQQINRQYTAAYQQKDYEQSIAALLQQIELIDRASLSREERATWQRSIDGLKATIYYNMACSYSLLKQNRKAIDAFGQAVQCGYQEYRHVLTDTDLDNIRKDKRFVRLVNSIRQYDKLVVLQHAGTYDREDNDSLPPFTYQPSGDNNLKLIREQFHLDSVAGQGDEVSKIIRILGFVHNTFKHNGNNRAVCEYNAIDLYHYNKATEKGINCRMLAITLNEMYLAMGFPSRYVTCMPKDSTDYDCHVINCVWSSELGKWLWMDPTFNAYVKDEQGHLLGISEVRDRLICGQPLALNEDANWNNQSPETKEHYLDYYMAKNLYWIVCVNDSRFNPESPYRYMGEKYIALLPKGLNGGWIRRSCHFTTHNADWFWQKPKLRE